MLSLVAGQGQVPARDRETEIWKSLSPSLVVLKGDLGEPKGLAVLIDPTGLFLTHQSQISSGSATAEFSDGTKFRVTVVGKDSPSQLACLKAEDWKENGRQPVSLGAADASVGSVLTAVTLTGPIRAQQTANAQAGVVKPSLRYLPVNEIMLERTSLPVGGAMLFNENSELVGLLGATIEPVQVGQFLSIEPSQLAQTKNYGPRGLTVGYSLGPRVLQRVVNGFRSPGHKVEYPSIGLQFRNAPNTGALIVSVEAQGPAGQAGLKPDDVVTHFNGKVIRGGLDFALALFESSVGESITIQFRRGTEAKEITIVVGGQVPAGSL